MRNLKIDLIKKHFENTLPAVIEDDSDYPMLLICLGEKPAALTMNPSEKEIEAIDSFCEDFGFKMKVRSGRTSKPADCLGKERKSEGKCIFIARKSERFDILEESEGRFYGSSDRSVGKFLGFPKSSIEFFLSTDQPGMESRKKIEQMKEEIGEENLKYLGLTTFIPKPEKKDIQKAIEIGKKRADILNKMDEKYQTGIGHNYIESRFEASFYG